MNRQLRLVSVPDKIKDTVPEGYKERKAAKYVGVGIHLFRRLVKEGRIVPRLLGKTRIYLRQDLDEFLQGLPADREAHRMRAEDPARHHGKEENNGHQGTP